MKSSTARLKISGCSQYDECPASSVRASRLFGISAAIIREIDGGVDRSAVPAISSVGSLSLLELRLRDLIPERLPIFGADQRLVLELHPRLHAGRVCCSV